ncbi:Glycosyltransferase involved in cell wall bisynthesis [Methanosarcina thermophila]|uniref:Glycosyltransferase n=3 Tax=Methanosarcina thermophila TaxID=2210 RepID=A0A1I7AFC4_METTE|nr:glycosyltransferase family 4 protein [Methanosarcina thermophila]ALK06152.1 MAG: glycosyl transferase [Methanosarcina sp. 795]AKB12235.1 glycosyltransferase (group I) [Methanosarcina thermophila TM-1]AKB14562.1 glycosyltransferase (group I) [Methanosarcina thermophila CHTI-55]NLU58094.1 glycosyltransferase [Methanosarcina thermophila]SFT73595.1 Glycosyltransferase involved in cell wall bisynthesis [Methanosarcina thermophila]
MNKQLKVLFIGTYVPKECGIATFTADLLNSVSWGYNDIHCEVIALNDPSETHNYPDEVVFQIQRDRIEDYYRAADYINQSDIDIVCLQHEFGLFWGNAGDYIFALLSGINKPVISTMHTVIREPEPEYRVSTEKLIRYSEKLIVMSQTAVDMLKDVYKAPADKIELIFHGVPDYPFDTCDKYKKMLNLKGSPLVLTFGLLSPNKGIESMLDALPEVVSQYPDLVYLILGATHPMIKKNFGEAYREYLKNKVSELGLEKNVVFHDKFVEKEELCKYILASDIYVSPYLSKEQIVSGALTYAIGMGKAIISTPYWYAQEMLADNRGLLVDFGDTNGFRDSLLHLIESPEECDNMRKKAYDFGRKMTWKNVGKQYNTVFTKALKSYSAYSSTSNRFSFLPNELPEVKLDYLKLLTDDVGIIQHSNLGVPARHHGYSTDDVGRALVALTKLIDSQKKAEELWKLITTYMSFLEHAQTETGHFHNFMSYKREFLDEKGSEDTLGRAIYGLGHVVSCPYLSRNMRTLAHTLISKAMPEMKKLSYPRAKAYTMCGLYEILRTDVDVDEFEPVFNSRRDAVKPIDSLASKDDFESIFISHADSLVELYEANHKEDWDWFEPIVTYSNAKLSEALLLAYDYTKDRTYRKVGLATLDFLTEIQWKGDFFDVVGNDGWYSYNGEKPIFDQQPIEAGYLTQAYISAYEIVRDRKYLELAKYAFEYFLGRNRLQAVMYDYSTGAVCDGLNRDGMNCNQGAESVICFLMALTSLNKHMKKAFSTTLLQSSTSGELDDGALEKRKSLLSANQAE